MINNTLQRKIEQTLWDLEEDSCAIASFAVRTLCATVHHVFEDFESVVHEFMRLVAVNIHHHAHAAIICTVTSILFFFIPIQPGYMWLMITIVVLTSIGVGLYSPLLWSMYADVADYATEKNGTSSTDLIFSSGTMAQKLGGAVSGSLIALLLGVAGATMIEDAMGNTTIDPASVTDSVKNMIWMLFSIFPAIMAELMILLLKLYPIKK